MYSCFGVSLVGAKLWDKLHGNLKQWGKPQDGPQYDRYRWSYGTLIIAPYTWVIGFVHPTYTLPETNIAPENGWLEDVFPSGKAYFQVLC